MEDATSRPQKAETNAPRIPIGLARAVDGSVCPIDEAVRILFRQERDQSGTFHGVRRLIKGRTGARIGHFSSARNGGNIPTESRLEYRVALALERDLEIRKFRSQPLTIGLSVGEYTPDLTEWRFSGKRTLIEVKPFERLAIPEIAQKLSEAKQVVTSNGFDFRVITERDLPDPEHEELLSTFRTPYVPCTRLITAAYTAFRSLPTHVTWTDISSRLKASGWNEGQIRSLVFFGIVLIRPSASFTPSTQVYWGNA